MPQRRIATVDGRFNRIRQVAAMCPPMIAHWRHLANAIELVHPRSITKTANRSVQPSSSLHSSRQKVPVYFTTGAAIRQNCLFPWGGDLDHHLTHDSLAHASPYPKRYFHPFHRFCTDDHRVSLYFTMVRAFPPQNCPCNTWFLGLTRVLNPNGISIASAVFAGLTSVTD